MFLSAQAALRRELCEGTSTFSFTWDAWSCCGDFAREFIAASGHCINSKWELLRCCLFVKRIFGLLVSFFLLTSCCVG
jgi:hypothetical protein